MKKYMFLSLLCVPMVAFAAPSVRMLGEKTSGVPVVNTVSATKTLPAKMPAATNNTVSNSRVGSVRPKTVSGTVSSAPKANVGNDSRFPAISSSHIYTSVGTPKQTGGTTVVNNSNVDLDNYYNKTEVNNIVDALKDRDDPRFDMIQVSNGNPKEKWKDHELYQQRIDEGYVFMWVEED